MKILQVSKFYHPIPGGIERVAQQFAEEMRARGHEASVLAARKRGLGTRETVDGVPVQRAGSLGVTLSTPLSPTFPYHLDRLARAADVVHYHVPNPVAVTSHLLVRPDAPAVVTYHSDIVKQSGALRLYRPLLTRFLDSLDQVVTTSPELRDRSTLLRDYRAKTAVVPLGIDVDALRETGRETLPPVEPDEPLVLFVGRLTYYKGVSVLLRAMARTDRGVLAIAGEGELRERLVSQARDLGIADRVRFLGYVSEDELGALYRRATVFVLPSVAPSEAFGIVQLEAMARGLPVINTDLPTGVPWVSRDRETGLTVPPGEAEALAAAIDRLLRDPALRERLGRQGRRRVEAEFTESAMVSGVEAVYEDLLE